MNNSSFLIKPKPGLLVLPSKTLKPALSPSRKLSKLSAAARCRMDNKIRPVFYTLPGTKNQTVALWVTGSAAEKAPLLDGSVDGKAVILWSRHSPETGCFYAVYDAYDIRENQHRQIGTANVVVTLQAKVRFCLRLYTQKNKIWASVLRDAPTPLLILGGFRPELLEQRRAQLEPEGTPSQLQTAQLQETSSRGQS